MFFSVAIIFVFSSMGFLCKAEHAQQREVHGECIQSIQRGPVYHQRRTLNGFKHTSLTLSRVRDSMDPNAVMTMLLFLQYW